MRLLGSFMVSVGDLEIPENKWRLRKAASVVKLLALAPGHRMHREQIMDTLWPDLKREASYNNLRRTLHAARQVLARVPAESGRYLLRQREDLALCPGERVWVDVEAFEEAASAARRGREPVTYRAAIDLYAGDLLPGDRYEDWAEERRQQLRRTYLSLLVELAELCEELGEYEAALEALEKAVAEEPANAEAHLGLMRIHALSGHREEALRHYDRLEEVLSRELGTKPDTAARYLRDEIGTGRFPPRQTDELSIADRSGGAAPGSPRHNLPAARTSFVGREREMLEVKRELAMTRLLTLTGAGGSGKTRLALEVARNLTGSYPDGVRMAELAPLSDGALVPQAVAGAMEVQERPGQPLAETLAEALRDRRALLVLDNCEHLVEASARLADRLLDSCPDLRILATSREVLGVAGEVRWTVPALSTPEVRRVTKVADLEGYESARLFAQRARQRDPSFALTVGNAPAVADICRRLEGVPLAVELAAARVQALGVSQVSERLEDSLGLLAAGRTAAPRQRTLRGALDWSFELLSEQEQTLFGRLSVFAGGWTLGAAEVVGSGNGIREHEVLDLLPALVDKSLVSTEMADEDGVRYRFLETVRQYAQERLEKKKDNDSVRRRHAGFFLELAEEAAPGLRGPDQRSWRWRLEADLDNIRAALKWLTEQGETEMGLRLGSALLFFWMWRGSIREGSRWLEEGLGEDDAVSGTVRAKAMNALADVKIMLGEYDRSHALLEEGLSLYRAAGDEDGVAACQCDLGWLALFQGDYRRATELLETSLIRFRESGNVLRTAFALNRLAGVAGSNLDHEKARKLLEESAALYRRVGDGKSLAMSLSMLGYQSFRRGDIDRAVGQIEESMARIREAGLATDAFTLNVLALTVMARGEYQRAGDLIAESLIFARTSGNRLHAIQGIETAAMLATALEDPETAAKLWGAAESAHELLGTPLDPDDQEFFGPHLAAGHAALGEDAWSAAWNIGREITLDEAVDYILSSGEETADTQIPSAPVQVEDPATLLSRREKEVAALVSQGLTNRRISSQLYISERTVENHVANILKKLGVRSREQVAANLGES